MEKLDCRGMDCPDPVIETKKALKEYDDIKILVDNSTAAKNIIKMAENEGFKTEKEKNQSRIVVKIYQQQEKNEEDSQENRKGEEIKTGTEQYDFSKNTEVYFITSKELGEGPEELGEMLMEGFLRTLISVDPLPEKLVFINEGVKLATVQNSTVEILEDLQEAGCEIFSCGTCLEYYELKEKLKVGEVSNMYEIVEIISHNKTLKI